MAGTLIPFLPMTAFDFSFLTSGSKLVVITPALNLTPFYYVRLIVRIHQMDFATGNIVVGGYSTDPSREDPQEFVITTSPAISSTINSGSSVGLASATATDPYPYWKMYVQGNYGSAVGRIFAVLSADLLLREA